MKKSLFKIFLGNLIMAFAYAKWMVPNGIINGGATSLAMILATLSGLPLLWLTNGIEVVLLLCCAVFLGKENALKSLFTSISFLISFNLIYSWSTVISFGLIIDLLLASIFIGFGYYCNLSENSTTVSIDVFALIIHKYTQKISIPSLIRYLNWLVLLAGFFVYGLKSVAIGIVLSFIFTFVLKKMMKLNEEHKMFI